MPRAPSSYNEFQYSLSTETFPFVSVSVSLSRSVSTSLWVSLVSQHPSPGEQSWGGGRGWAVGTGPRPVLTKDNKVRKGLEPRPGADSPSLPALGAPFPADPQDALNARRPLLPAPVLGGGVQPLPGQGSPLVSPSHCPLLRWHHLLPQGVHLWDRSPPCVIYSCFRSRQRVSGPRVREQEETSGFPRSSRGRPPLSPLGLQPPGWSRAPGVLGPRG